MLKEHYKRMRDQAAKDIPKNMPHEYKALALYNMAEGILRGIEMAEKGLTNPKMHVKIK